MSLIQGVKSDITAKIERCLIVLVFSEESQALGQSKPHSAQSIESWTGISASPYALAGNPCPKDSESDSGVRLKALAVVAGNQVQCPGGHPDMGP